MTVNSSLLALLALLAACSCGRTPTDSRVTTGEPSADSSVPLFTETVITDQLTAVPPDAYTPLDVAVRGDTLVAHVQYGGGCRTHELRLVLVRGFMESNPVQMRALIDHRANGDACKALLTRELRFDLRPLRELYRQSYPAGPGVVRLQLLPPIAQMVEYRF